MANKLYDTARDAFANGDIDWPGDDIRCCLVNSTYVPDLANDEFLSDATAGIVANSKLGASLANKTTDAGVCDADNCVLGSANITGTPVAIVIYVHNASESAAQLIAYLDSVTGLPASFVNATINVAWDSGANRIFKL